MKGSETFFKIVWSS